MCCHFYFFNSPLHFPVRGGKYRNQHPLSFFSLYCYVTQPITHMRTQEVSKDLYENPFCTFSRKELEKSLYGIWESEPVGVGHMSAWCALSQLDSLKGLNTKSGLMFIYFFSCFLYTPTHYPALSPSPHLLVSLLLRQSLPQLLSSPFIVISAKLAFGKWLHEAVIPHEAVTPWFLTRSSSPVVYKSLLMSRSIYGST